MKSSPETVDAAQTLEAKRALSTIAATPAPELREAIKLLAPDVVKGATVGLRAVTEDVTVGVVETFEARDGDKLVVTYGAVKLQIASFSMVELDSAIYERKMIAGESVGKQHEVIYDFLRDKCLGRAKAKLATFADELRRAKIRAGEIKE